MTKLDRHRIDEAINSLTNILEKLAKEAEAEATGKFSKEKVQRINRLCFIVKDFFTRMKKQPAATEYEFFEKASLLVDQIVLVRDSKAFIDKAKGTSLLQQFDDIIALIYAVVYDNPIVQKLIGKVNHVSTKLAMVADVATAQKIADETWEKMNKVEAISDDADKKLLAVVKKLQDLYDAQVMEMPDELIEKFKKVSMEAYAIGAAATLALEESALAKAYVEKIIAQKNQG